jgi:DNA-binding NtrC family response regulator
MTESLDGLRSCPILVVDTRVAALRRTSDLLRRAGFDVIEAGSFNEAKRSLVDQSPALLISSLRLAAFNGLHLVHLARLAQPQLHAIITSTSADAMLQSEAEQVGASLLLEPVPPALLQSLIFQILGGHASIGLSAGLERRQFDRRQTVDPDFGEDRRVTDRRAAVVSLLRRNDPLSSR